ncbi:MAG: hypothetical protein LUO87_04830 [Methanomicrobiales archaeon]|nr:hypothetical protein [Methanomicrobiales archaeon]MDD1659889.1 hypothetical protein [Methanomicrobiales archaeon]
MDQNQKRILAAGLLVCVAVAIFQIYFALILLVILITVLISLQIMRETRGFPDITCRLQEDAKGIAVRNRGNAKAVAIHLAVVPLDLEFDIPPLEPEETTTLAVPHMISEAKAVITFENEAGRKYSRTVMVSATGEGEEDLLKPMIPLFGWK